MQRNEAERRREPRRKTEREAAQPAGGQARSEEDGDEAAQDSNSTPSFLTAHELQAWDPAKSAERREIAADRRRSSDAPRTVHKQE